MWLINIALRRPITILVAVIGIALLSALALTRMSVDTFPNLNLPVVYVAQPYGGMDPQQMESFLVNYYEYHFLYTSGVEHVESKSIQGAGLVKIFFHPGTDISQALAQVVSYVERSRAFRPPGTVAPFVVRYDAGSVPVGYLTFASETRDLGEISDLALNRIRPVFSTLPGVSAPPPFAGTITERFAHPGALGGTTQPVLRLQQISRLRLVVAVPEAELACVVKGTRVEFTVPAFPGETFTGSIARIGNSLDSKTRTMPVELDVNNPAKKLAPGMFPQVNWPSHRPHPSLFVPLSAVATTTEKRLSFGSKTTLPNG